MTYLTAFLEVFRFIKRYRERAAAAQAALRAEAAAERAHQLSMMDSIFSKMVELSRTNNEGVLALAKAQTAQSDVMSTWLKGFHIADPSPALPQVVRDEDEWARENSMADVLKQLPEEFSLAWALQQQEAANDNPDRDDS